jgi:hypothetical protein
LNWYRAVGDDLAKPAGRITTPTLYAGAFKTPRWARLLRGAPRTMSMRPIASVF